MFYPLGMKTKICDKRNLRNLIEMSHNRICNRAYHEYRKVMREICKELMLISDEWAWIVENLLVPKCDVLGYCPEKKGCGRKPNK
jgi:Thymidylate synthase complementing protein.